MISIQSEPPSRNLENHESKLTWNSIASDKKSTTPAAAAKPAFSFAATMAGLAKQKEEIPSKAEETRKPETAEEKRKRLRKEQRRKLRVSFKNEDELVSIRTFMHDPEEEIGHEDSQVRDVGDSKGEGQMLKMHKDLELDDDEEYEPPDDISPPWIAPQGKSYKIFCLCRTNALKRPTSA